jgi:hypothetical protein
VSEIVPSTVYLTEKELVFVNRNVTERWRCRSVRASGSVGSSAPMPGWLATVDENVLPLTSMRVLLVSLYDVYPSTVSDSSMVQSLSSQRSSSMSKIVKWKEGSSTGTPLLVSKLYVRSAWLLRPTLI